VKLLLQDGYISQCQMGPRLFPWASTSGANQVVDQPQVSLFHHIPANRRIFLFGPSRQPSTQATIAIYAYHLLRQFCRVVRLKLSQRLFAEVVAYCL
jgi:hypothetical protein